MLQRGILIEAMRRALTLAGRGPDGDINPQVGCVILDPQGCIVAEGWHEGSGTAHAEVAALARVPAAWRERAHDLTAVVTLEPCNHTGRTGPCAEALVDFGIGAVAYSLGDPGDASSGGAATLADHGIEVTGGILAGETRALLAPWLASAASSVPDAVAAGPQPELLARPHVTVKWAQTLDGRAAAADGSSQWITGPDARGDVHRRRAEADVIVVGTGTLFADDPALTARAETGGLLVPAAEQPIPVVIGSREIPADSRVRSHPALAAHDLTAPLQYDGADLALALHDLHARGVRRVFVEGGPSLVSSFLATGLVDEVLIYLAPSLLGGPKLAVGDIGIANIADIHRLSITHFAQLGVDLLIKATLPAQALTPASSTAPSEGH